MSVNHSVSDLVARLRNGYLSKKPVINNGLGMVILSSSRGIITDYQARDQKIGGELLIKIF